MTIAVDQSKASHILRERFKAKRLALVDAITVEVDGMMFQGDEVSHTRMSRAIVALSDGETAIWVLADNTSAQVSKAQLTEALRLSGQAQSEIWVQK